MKEKDCLALISCPPLMWFAANERWIWTHGSHIENRGVTWVRGLEIRSETDSEGTKGSFGSLHVKSSKVPTWSTS